MAHNTIIAPEGTGQPGRGGTRVDTSDPEMMPVTRRAESGNKITGVLCTFVWRAQGDLFVLYEGRNVIGKGYVESEGGRPCDVLLNADASMSNEHAVILCRAGRYELFDRQSTNGTFVDDVFVESHGVILKDGARIKTGATIWLFRKIESDSSGVVTSHTRHGEPPGLPPTRDPSTVR